MKTNEGRYGRRLRGVVDSEGLRLHQIRELDSMHSIEDIGMRKGRIVYTFIVNINKQIEMLE